MRARTVATVATDTVLPPSASLTAAAASCGVRARYGPPDCLRAPEMRLHEMATAAARHGRHHASRRDVTDVRLLAVIRAIFILRTYNSEGQNNATLLRKGTKRETIARSK